MFTPLFDDSNLMPGDNSGIDGDNGHSKECNKAYEQDNEAACICADFLEDESNYL
jgi:hypothetical protein